MTESDTALALALALWVQEPERNLDRAQVLDMIANWVDKHPMTIDQLEETAKILRERK